MTLQVVLICTALIIFSWSFAGYVSFKRDQDRAKRLLSPASSAAVPNAAEESASQQRATSSDLVAPQNNLHRLLFMLLGAGIGLLCALFFGSSRLASLIVPTLSGLGSGWLLHRAIQEAKIKRVKEDIEFYIPVFMEQVVMAVQAGLDIIPAIRAALDGGACGESKLAEQLHNVLELTERGLPFISSLDEIASKAPTQSVKHAFMHLKLAFSQGGELVRPLRELSDATQLQYQETVEEEIAKLPVKAVLPLVCTFAGLMICFLTVPLVQLSSIMKKVAPQESSK